MHQGSEVCLRNERSSVDPGLGKSRGVALKKAGEVGRGQIMLAMGGSLDFILSAMISLDKLQAREHQDLILH